MWTCEVKESIGPTEERVLAKNSVHQYQAQQPTGEPEQPCTALPHGTCNYLVTKNIALTLPALLSLQHSALTFHYVSLVHPTPTEPPRA